MAVNEEAEVVNLALEVLEVGLAPNLDAARKALEAEAVLHLTAGF